MGYPHAISDQKWNCHNNLALAFAKRKDLAAGAKIACEVERAG
jgi:hypothetical protein